MLYSINLNFVCIHFQYFYTVKSIYVFTSSVGSVEPTQLRESELDYIPFYGSLAKFITYHSCIKPQKTGLHICNWGQNLADAEMQEKSWVSGLWLNWKAIRINISFVSWTHLLWKLLSGDKYWTPEYYFYSVCPILKSKFIQIYLVFKHSLIFEKVNVLNCYS